MIRRVDLVGCIAVAAVAATIVAYWLPIFQVGGFVYTMIDSFGGRGQFVAAVALPIVLGVAVLAFGWPSRGCASVAALAAAVMATLAPVDHLAEAAWQREHPERLGAPFEFRIGFAVAAIGIVGGAIVFVVVIRALLAEPPRAGEADKRTDLGATIAAIGLLVAVVGQLAESSTAHLWQLPRWPQAGRWWELLVTTSICGLAVWRRTPMALASAALVSIVAAASEAQLFRAVSSLEDDPAVSSIVRLAGFVIVAAALTVTLVGSLRRR